EPERPNVEELTPPPTDFFTPTDSPNFRSEDVLWTPGHTPAQPPSEPSYLAASTQSNSPPPPASTDPRYGTPLSGGGGGGPAKKRKLDVEFEGFGAGEDAMAGLDEDVAELLRAESGG
ncbi:MAG: hypothetical protein Q9184_008213, partial [Pyrenodesmia sp. 2 TL-2023]